MDLFLNICEDYNAIGGGYLGLSSMQSDVFSDKLLFERLDHLERFPDIRPYTTTFLVGAAKFSDEQLLKFLKSMKTLQISFGGFDKDSYKIMYGINGYEIARQQLDRIGRLIKENRLGLEPYIFIRTPDKAAAENSDFVKTLPSCFYVANINDQFFSWGGLIGESDLPQGARLVRADNSDKRVDCSIPWASLSVNVDGTVVGCGCVDWNSKHLIGDLKVQSIEEVWQGAPAREFRRAFSSGKVPDLCMDCDYYMRVDHAFSRPEQQNWKPTDSLYWQWSVRRQSD